MPKLNHNQYVRKCYPLDEAVKLAAEQNIDRDIRAGLVLPYEKSQQMDKYLDEARHLLVTEGENHLPEYPDADHICTRKA